MGKATKITTSELVLSAIFFLQQQNGVSAKEITKYICQKRGCTQSKIKSSIQKALERATKNGIFTKKRGLYRIESHIKKVRKTRKRKQPIRKRRPAVRSKKCHEQKPVLATAKNTSEWSGQLPLAGNFQYNFYDGGRIDEDNDEEYEKMYVDTLVNQQVAQEDFDDDDDDDYDEYLEDYDDEEDDFEDFENSNLKFDYLLNSKEPDVKQEVSSDDVKVKEVREKKRIRNNKSRLDNKYKNKDLAEGKNKGKPNSVYAEDDITEIKSDDDSYEISIKSEEDFNSIYAKLEEEYGKENEDENSDKSLESFSTLGFVKPKEESNIELLETNQNENTKATDVGPKKNLDSTQTQREQNPSRSSNNVGTKNQLKESEKEKKSIFHCSKDRMDVTRNKSSKPSQKNF